MRGDVNIPQCCSKRVGDVMGEGACYEPAVMYFCCGGPSKNWKILVDE